MEDRKLEKEIKKAYAIDEWVYKINKDPTLGYKTNEQGLVRFRGLVYILGGIRRSFIRD